MFRILVLDTDMTTDRTFKSMLIHILYNPNPTWKSMTASLIMCAIVIFLLQHFEISILDMAENITGINSVILAQLVLWTVPPLAGFAGGVHYMRRRYRKAEREQ